MYVRAEEGLRHGEAHNYGGGPRSLPQAEKAEKLRHGRPGLLLGTQHVLHHQGHHQISRRSRNLQPQEEVPRPAAVSRSGRAPGLPQRPPHERLQLHLQGPARFPRRAQEIRQNQRPVHRGFPGFVLRETLPKWELALCLFILQLALAFQGNSLNFQERSKKKKKQTLFSVSFY